MKRKLFLWLSIVALVSFLWSYELRADINLEWDAATDNVGVMGYELHYGSETGIYTDFIDVGNVTAFTFVDVDATYFFVILAYDAKKNKSDFSNEVSDYIDTVSPMMQGTLRIVK